MRTGRRGMLLVVVLLLSSILLVLGLAYLSRTVSQYRAASSAADSALAYQYAVAGLEAARVRLDKDPSFPPSGLQQDIFSCCEPVYGLDGITPVGYSLLTVDTHWRSSPYFTVRVSSVGCLGDPGQPRARRKVRAEIDVDPSPAHAATRFKIVQWRDEGSL